MPTMNSGDTAGRADSAGPAHPVGHLAALVSARVVGDEERCIRRLASLGPAGSDALVYIDQPRYLEGLATSRAGAVLLRETAFQSLDEVERERRDRSYLIVDKPHVAFARLSRVFAPRGSWDGVHPRAVVHPSVSLPGECSIGPGAVIESGVQLGERVRIGANAYVGAGVVLGDDVVIDPSAVLYRTVQIGARSRIFAGAVIGADGFGFADQGPGRTPRVGDRWVRVEHFGSVMIGADVEVGAGATIDRGALDDTVVRDGVKIDNLVHVGHNCDIGEDSALAGCVGLAGSAVIGRDCLLAGGVGVVGHTRMCDGVVAQGMTMVTRSINTPGVVASGVPHHDVRTWNRMLATLRRLARR